MKFKNMGHADRILKICREVLSENVSGPEEAILGRDRVRNALCRGFGYQHYPALERALIDRRNRTECPPGKEELESALARGFEGALEVARERGFDAKASVPVLVRLAVTQILNWQDQRLKASTPAEANQFSAITSSDLFPHSAPEAEPFEQFSFLSLAPEASFRRTEHSKFRREDLVHAVGYRLTAYIAGANSIKSIEQWITNGAPPDKEPRLRATLLVITPIVQAESTRAAQAFLTTPRIDLGIARTPAHLLRDAPTEEALSRLTEIVQTEAVAKDDWRPPGSTGLHNNG